MEDQFNRTEAILGIEAMEKLARTKVIIFGIGGVGSWCAEALIRTGIGHITLVDSDIVDLTNINRQSHAFFSTLNMPKVQALEEKLLDINPKAEIIAVKKGFEAENCHDFSLGDYDFIIDAIDSLGPKLLLIKSALSTQSHFFSSMGSANKRDPSSIKTGNFWQITGCPLARKIRQNLRKEGFDRDFITVYSTEMPIKRSTESVSGKQVIISEGNTGINHQGSLAENIGTAYQGSLAENIGTAYLENPSELGSLMQVTAVFGLNLAALVINRATLKGG